MSLEQLLEAYQRLRTDCSRLEQEAIRIRREAERAEKALHHADLLERRKAAGVCPHGYGNEFVCEECGPL